MTPTVLAGWPLISYRTWCEGSLLQSSCYTFPYMCFLELSTQSPTFRRAGNCWGWKHGDISCLSLKCPTITPRPQVPDPVILPWNGCSFFCVGWEEWSLSMCTGWPICGPGSIPYSAAARDSSATRTASYPSAFVFDFLCEAGRFSQNDLNVPTLSLEASCLIVFSTRDGHGFCCVLFLF